jgi:hypothetical protein
MQHDTYSEALICWYYTSCYASTTHSYTLMTLQTHMDGVHLDWHYLLCVAPACFGAPTISNKRDAAIAVGMTTAARYMWVSATRADLLHGTINQAGVLSCKGNADQVHLVRPC